ncbi:MAG: hypothetical protein IPM91_21815 [Bacteroidetes bacterium]|nr:hypothetical protein [Bacteroidota bacterium]
MRICGLLVFAFFLSCSGRVEKNPENSRNANVSDVSLVKQGVGAAQMLSRQPCFADNQLTHSVYYQASFSEHARFPVFILFDPHADGDFPLTFTNRWRINMELYYFLPMIAGMGIRQNEPQPFYRE